MDIMVDLRDFTMGKYAEVCNALLSCGYRPSTVSDFLSGRAEEPTVVLRHDVDRKVKNASRMAELEHSLGIHASYYFRHPYTFDQEVITHIANLGHEVGYHYEVLAKAKGDKSKALDLFAKELEEFRRIADVRTVCMHGSPLSHYDNRALWKDHEFRDFDIQGEAFLSMEGKGLRYLTDTGRNWNGKHSLRDAIPGSEPVPVETTDELIAWIGSTHVGLYLTAHPERWAMSTREWVGSSISDFVINTGKRALRVRR